MLKLQKTLFVGLFGWRVDNPVPELVEFLPLFNLGKGWLAVGEYCLVGMPEAEELRGSGKKSCNSVDTCKTAVCQNNRRKRRIALFVQRFQPLQSPHIVSLCLAAKNANAIQKDRWEASTPIISRRGMPYLLVLQVQSSRRISG